MGSGLDTRPWRQPVMDDTGRQALRWLDVTCRPFMDAKFMNPRAFRSLSHHGQGLRKMDCPPHEH